MRIQVNFESLEEFMSFMGQSTPDHVEAEPVKPQPESTPQPEPVNEEPAAVQEAAAPQPAPVPTKAVTYKRDDLAVAAMQIMDQGHQADLQELLARFGVRSLPDLPEEQYGAFATALRGMGAQI